jgi:hypothetical protein
MEHVYTYIYINKKHFMNITLKIENELHIASGSAPLSKDKFWARTWAYM